MIRLRSPSLVVNDSRSNMVLRMNHVISAGPRDSVGFIINQIAARANRRRPLKNVVFNCHGSPNFLQVGWGISRSDAPLFSRLRGRVEKIWFYACRPAGLRVGLAFCSRVAVSARCYVLASPDTQWESAAQMAGLPFNSLDTFEGKLISFDRNGNVSWTRTYPSGRANP